MHITILAAVPANVPLYEHLGYRIVGRARIADTLQTWGFFRSDDAAGGRSAEAAS